MQTLYNAQLVKLSQVDKLTIIRVVCFAPILRKRLFLPVKGIFS